MPFAAIFPGQGAATPGAGEVWRDHPAWSVVDHAEQLLDEPLARLLLEADADELATTRASQLAVLLTSLMCWSALTEDTSEQPMAFAGHSLGQITALITSQAVGMDDGLRLARERAELSQRSADANGGRMAALMGANIHTAERICADADVWIANDNAPGQVVVAGTPDAIELAQERAKAHGVRKAIPLAVGHAFHTPLLADAAEGLRPTLDAITFHEPTAPIVANTDALAHTDPDCWPDQLARHLVQPVRWRDCQRTLAALGAHTLVEIGPGRVLSGLARRTVPELQVLSVATPDQAEAGARDLAAESSPPLASTPPAPPEDS